ncbi:MAG TPA: hypothetical protein PLD20_32155, partial [Blastocatellia bacterium]|nr:hypothetical protein [Blastocatellia bacterium]HMZ22627.1 hypothetical protein [Blastocatellia bacterium]
MIRPQILRLSVFTVFLIFAASLFIGLPPPEESFYSRAAEMTPEQRGQWNLQHQPYGRPLPIKQVLPLIANKAWEPEWKAKLDASNPDSLRKVAFERYGFSEATWDNDGAPLQFVATKQGWVQTCMLCHGGRVPITGESKIGMPNTELD